MWSAFEQTLALKLRQEGLLRTWSGEELDWCQLGWVIQGRSAPHLDDTYE